jgi:hypothetical protein
MKLAMNAGFYRGYLTEERSLMPLTIVLASGVALWLLLYLLSVVGPAPMTPSALVPPHGTLAIVEPPDPF